MGQTLDKRRKVYKPNIKRSDALTLWAGLNNVTRNQAGNNDYFHAIAEFTEALGDYFAFTEQDEKDAEAARASRDVSSLLQGRPVFLYK